MRVFGALQAPSLPAWCWEDGEGERVLRWAVAALPYGKVNAAGGSSRFLPPNRAHLGLSLRATRPSPWAGCWEGRGGLSGGSAVWQRLLLACRSPAAGSQSLSVTLSLLSFNFSRFPVVCSASSVSLSHANRCPPPPWWLRSRDACGQLRLPRPRASHTGLALLASLRNSLQLLIALAAIL